MSKDKIDKPKPKQHMVALRPETFKLLQRLQQRSKTTLRTPGYGELIHNLLAEKMK